MSEYRPVAAVIVAADAYARTPDVAHREALKAAVRALPLLTADEARTLRLVACGFRGAPQGTGWDDIVAKLRRVEGSRSVSDKDRS